MALEEDNLPQRPHRKRRLRWGRLVFFIVLLAAVVTAGFWGAVWCYDNLIAPPKVDVVGADSKITADETLNSRINVLLLGIDDGDSEAAESEPKRTDAMMLASFDPEGNEVALVSMPRDTMVQIPGHKGYDKINAAYAYGGVILAKQTVANLLRVPIHYYVLVDWRAFKESIDLIGGVDLYVDKDMYYEDPYADLVIDIKHGYQHLNGELAGQYVRFRKDELGDIGRVQRQQKEHAMVADAEDILSFLKKRGGKMPYCDDTPMEIIKEKFGISKAAFKRALGRLLRQGLIRQEEGWTILLENPEDNKK